MSKNIDNIHDALIMNAGSIAAKMRLNKSMGQLYAALYFSDEPVALEDLAKKCRMSKGNASINMRHLERWNAVIKTFGHGDRKNYYEANKDIMNFIVERGKSIFFDILARGEAVIKQTSDVVNSFAPENEEDKKKLEGYTTKLNDLKDKFDKLKSLANGFSMIEKLL
ncbi:MAG: hypothetical protein HQL28_04375 [Candidatus Omnitrophica bacterium]|nr:hypothetical protein [Candidatus Omnitrophota bacterium]